MVDDDRLRILFIQAILEIYVRINDPSNPELFGVYWCLTCDMPSAYCNPDHYFDSYVVMRGFELMDNLLRIL